MAEMIIVSPNRISGPQPITGEQLWSPRDINTAKTPNAEVKPHIRQYLLLAMELRNSNELFKIPSIRSIPEIIGKAQPDIWART